MTAPTAEDVVMFAVHDARCPDRCDRTVIGITFGREAAAVVAAIRGMTRAQQAELIGGDVERRSRSVFGLAEARVVGPWRAEP